MNKRCDPTRKNTEKKAAVQIRRIRGTRWIITLFMLSFNNSRVTLNICQQCQPSPISHAEKKIQRTPLSFGKKWIENVTRNLRNVCLISSPSHKRKEEDRRAYGVLYFFCLSSEKKLNKSIFCSLHKLPYQFSVSPRSVAWFFHPPGFPSYLRTFPSVQSLCRRCWISYKKNRIKYGSTKSLRRGKIKPYFSSCTMCTGV